jgi:ATP-dependent Clp protease ATP-binding subunit ClpC
METTTLRPFTSRTRVALAIARGIAAARGDRDLTPTHIMVGILREGNNPAMGALWYAGVTEQDFPRLRFDFEHSLSDERGHAPPREVTIALTAGEESIINLADIEAQSFGDPYIGTEHILLALLRSDGATAARLAQHGITVQKYHEGMLSMRRGDPPPSEPRPV